MFRDKITETPFSTLEAGMLFNDKVFGDSYNADTTFVSTLRALVYPRMSEGDTVMFRYRNYVTMPTSSENDFDYRITRSIREETGVFEEPEQVLLIDCTRLSEDARKKYLSFVEDGFEKQYGESGFIRLNKMTDFFQKMFKVLCYTNMRTKSAVIFIEFMDLRIFHYIQCSIFAFMPWYFDPATGVSEPEMNLINSLRADSSGQYIECLKVLASAYDFKSAKIKRILCGFESKALVVERDAISAQIQSIIRQIRSENERIGQLFSDKQQADIKLLGTIAAIDNAGDESEVMEYFLANKSLDVVCCEDTTLTFIATGTIKYYDEDMAQRIIDNRGSYLYRTGIFGNDDVKRLMNLIFIEREYGIRVCGAYSLNIRGNAEAPSWYKYSSEYNTYLPNPHLQVYSCLGNNVGIINQALLEGNYIGAIEQCVSSCSSLNFADSAVMEAFVDMLFNGEYRGITCNKVCIELPNGKIVDAAGAIKFMKK